MSNHRFTVTREADAILIGKLDDSRQSGAYLTPEFLARLQEVHRATRVRIATLDIPELPDALRNLSGLIDRLLNALAQEQHAEWELARPAIEQARAEIDAALEKLRDPDGNGPSRA